MNAMSNRNILKSTRKILWGKSGGKCAISKTDLVQKKADNQNYPVGIEAHIEGLNPNSARYNPNMSDDERNSYENLILVCPTCHTKIDNNTDTYTVKKLKKIKEEHEKWVEENLKSHMPNVSFAELEVITKYLTSATAPKEEYLTVIPPKEKIRKNNLSSEVENLITMGMLRVNEVKEYLNRNPDPNFSERLRTVFVEKYKTSKDEGLTEDALFYGLLEFASNGSQELKIQAAGLAVLTYFFEICEVFEK